MSMHWPEMKMKLMNSKWHLLIFAECERMQEDLQEDRFQSAAIFSLLRQELEICLVGILMSKIILVLIARNLGRKTKLKKLKQMTG